MASFLTRYILVPLLPSALVAAPVASFLAESTGLAWTGTFIVLNLALLGVWGIAKRREEGSASVGDRIADPCFGELERRGDGPWWGSVALDCMPGLLPVSIEAGSDGPSESQRERFLDLQQRLPELLEPLRASLGQEVKGAESEDRSQLISLELMVDQAEAAIVTAWSVILEEGGSETYTVPLRVVGDGSRLLAAS